MEERVGGVENLLLFWAMLADGLVDLSATINVGLKELWKWRVELDFTALTFLAVVLDLVDLVLVEICVFCLFFVA